MDDNDDDDIDRFCNATKLWNIINHTISSTIPRFCCTIPLLIMLLVSATWGSRFVDTDGD